jgi:hypothetical protein
MELLTAYGGKQEVTHDHHSWEEKKLILNTLFIEGSEESKGKQT